jgi:hypothetical protein
MLLTRRQAIALGVLLLTIIIGLGGAYFFVFKDPPAQQSDIDQQARRGCDSGALVRSMVAADNDQELSPEQIDWLDDLYEECEGKLDPTAKAILDQALERRREGLPEPAGR